jgi:hypothetical protein
LIGAETRRSFRNPFQVDLNAMMRTYQISNLVSLSFSVALAVPFSMFCKSNSALRGQSSNLYESFHGGRFGRSRVKRANLIDVQSG